MAPIKATAVGVTPQIIDNKELLKLTRQLNKIKVKSMNSDEPSKDEIARLVDLLACHPDWIFEEQVDLHEWIPALDQIDASLAYFLKTFPNILLVPPLQYQERSGTAETDVQSDDDSCNCAQSLQDAESVPQNVIQSLCDILRFLSNLLHNSINKVIFNSVDALVDLLGAKDDTVATLSLTALSHLATPPSLHKQQAPEGHQHTSALHGSKQSHKRLVALAKGWGSRGSGLGLYVCVTADDSEYGHESWPVEAGEVRFQCFATDESSATADSEAEAVDNRKLISIHLTTSDIVTVPVNSEVSPEMEPFGKKQKRQKTSMEELRPRGMLTKSTSELFFQCLDAAGGVDQMPKDRLFLLLAEIRLSKAFHAAHSRIVAVENRLLALIAILYAHPSQDIMSGYFQAQPELCVELIDLLRPTVSSGAVSAASAKMGGKPLRAVEALSSPPEVPYSVRNLAVETLTALVARRDGANGGLTGVARQSNVLMELGVGKGMYVGLLPTLVRFSLASLMNFLTSKVIAPEDANSENKSEHERDIALDLGLAFLEAVRPSRIPGKDQIMRAIQFVDSVLSLTSAIVSAPSGTAVLTECGIIPALLSTVALDSNSLSNAVASLNLDLSQGDLSRIQAQVRFVTSQAIQIIEGAIVTHSNALSAFHDLNGVDILIARLHEEMTKAKEEYDHEMINLNEEPDNESVDMIDTNEFSCSSARKLVASRRVLLFSIVNCLTVAFHQESSTSALTPNGGSQLRKPELTSALIEVMQNCDAYGGVLAALTCSLLSDVMNSDPHVVYHVHQSGIAQAFFDMLARNRRRGSISEPSIPTVPELIMALPNVVAALSLTSEGATKVMEANPFPSMLRVLFHPKYAMPRSRCLLNDMTAIVGTGLDEVMRHVPSLRGLVMESIVHAMKELIRLGKFLVQREEQVELSDEDNRDATPLENERTCLMHYTLNFGQMLEQILHTEDHCGPFVEHGGLVAVLELFELLVPPTTQFLANACCLSSPSISTLAHTTTEDSLSVTFRCVAINYDSQKLLRLIFDNLEMALNRVEETQKVVRVKFPSGFLGECDDAFGILEGLPQEPVYHTRSQVDYDDKAKCLADYLRSVVIFQWQTNLLATIIKAASQRSQDSGWGRQEREWKKELSSESFVCLLSRMAAFNHSAILESCRVRSDDEFETQLRKRHLKYESSSHSIRYRLRIVCQEGAVVRDGIEIDSCSNIGSMEMGEVADAYERCVNSSGVMRYRTRRGWISELTRGHGREPIAEVLDVDLIESSKVPNPLLSSKSPKAKKRTEYGVASFRIVGSSILARLQTSHREFFSALSRVASSGVRSFPALYTRTMSFDPGTLGSHTLTLLKLFSSTMSQAINRPEVINVIVGGRHDYCGLNQGGVAMYFGSLLGIISSSLSDDKRERRSVNVALLLALLLNDNFFLCEVPVALVGDVVSKPQFLPVLGLFNAIKFVAEHSLESELSLKMAQRVSVQAKPVQSLTRITAASLPPVIALLRRLMAGAQIRQSPMTNTLERMDLADIAKLLGCPKECMANILFCHYVGDEAKFASDCFVRSIHFAVADLVLCFWKDPRFKFLPSHVIHPMTKLSVEIIAALEDVTKRSSALAAGLDRIGKAGQLREADQQQTESNFEPSEEAISRLMEMGFSREHAVYSIENTESNRLEVAMEYALLHPPPSPRGISTNENLGEETRVNRDDGAADLHVRNPCEQSTDHNDNQGNCDEKVNETSDILGDVAPLNQHEMTEVTIIQKFESCLESWIKGCPSLAINLLGDLSDSVISINADRECGDPETEALTVVLCTFLIGLCEKYHEQSDIIVRQLLSRLEQNFLEKQDKEGIVYFVKDGSEHSFSALCHASVLFAKAIPRTRLCMLEQNLLSRLVSCLSEVARSLDDPCCLQTKVCWPVWLAPSILLVDVMAQPLHLVSFPECERGASCDLEIVRNEHRRKVKQLSTMTHQLFSALHAVGKESHKSSQNELSGSLQMTEEPENVSNDTHALEGVVDESTMQCSSIPPFFPLIPDLMAKTAMTICLKILGKDAVLREGRVPPPGTVHATLLLMSRLLRYPAQSVCSLKDGAANLILSLPRECRFHGNAGLATIVLRRLLEDDSTLTNAMETEIRSVCINIHRKQNRQVSQGGEPCIPFNVLLKALTPLLCRDQWTFMKALVSTVTFTPKNSPTGQHMVTLLTQEDRQRNIRILSETAFWQRQAEGFGESPKSAKSLSQKRAVKTNTPLRRSFIRRGSMSKKGKKEKPDVTPFNGAPANHVMTLLVESMIQLTESVEAGVGNVGSTFGEDIAFLGVADLIEVMADLVLAFPACAAAMHRYRPSNKGSQNDPLSKLKHAVRGCPPPQRTVVNFLLHRMIPQDRWTHRQDRDMWDKRDLLDEVRKRKNKELYVKTKVAQATARLLVALVARAGEGRRRVVSDLASALSIGGHSSDVHNSSEPNVLKVSTSEDIGLFALQAWGDLCMGLAAPRSNGVNHDNNSNLSLEVVKLMLESKMVHCLLNALVSVDLNHPMATSTCASLLVPIEVFTRGSVTDAVEALENKELNQKDGQAKTPQNVVAIMNEDKISERGPDDVSTLRREPNFADEYMLADGFDAEAASCRLSTNHHNREDSENEMDMDDGERDEVALNEDVHMEVHSADDEEIESEDDDGASGMESEEGDHDDDDDDDDDEEDEEDEEELDSDSDDDGDDEEIADDDIEDNDEIMNSNRGWDEQEEYNYFEDSEEQGAEDNEQGNVDNDLDDWDQIEAPPFGLMLGSRRRRGNLSNRGFVDAAEAMIGNLLRTGEIHGDGALAEIEGTLGFRFSGTRNLPDWMERSRTNLTSPDDDQQMQGSRGTIVGAVPRINQRRPPDVGHPGHSSGGRWNDISSVEFVFGGPTLTGGSRNFDVSSDFQIREEGESYTLPSVVDSQLFPGGPVASTHARTEHSLHPLLGAIDLPPVNSLVSDLPSIEERLSRRGGTNARTLDGWTCTGYMLTTPNGRISRIAHTSDHGRVLRGTSGLVGWTDHGEPFDSSVESFSAAFELAFSEGILPPTETSTANVSQIDHVSQENVQMELNEEAEDFEARNNDVEHERLHGDQIREDEVLCGNDIASIDPIMDSSDMPVLQMSDNRAASEMVIDSLEVGDSLSNVNDVEPPICDGEGVAPSLVEGLCLTDGGAETAADDTVEVHSRSHREPEDLSAVGPDSVEDQPNMYGLMCPPGIDREVFNCLPEEMQREVVDQHQATLEIASQLDGTLGLDPEALAALPEEMRREVIAHEQREQRLRDSAPADPSNAEEMDNASFVASLAPDLRREILMTADDLFLSSLPPDIIAESQILRERASQQQRRLLDPSTHGGDDARASDVDRGQGPEEGSTITSISRKKQSGKIKVDRDRSFLIYLPPQGSYSSTEPIRSSDLKVLIRMMFLLSPVRPQRLLQKTIQNLCANASIRSVIISAFTLIMNDDSVGTRNAVESLDNVIRSEEGNMPSLDFPPRSLIGATPDVLDDSGYNSNSILSRRRHGSSCAASIAASLPFSLRGSTSQTQMPPVVSTRVIDTLTYLSKNSPRVCLDVLTNPIVGMETSDENEAVGCFDLVLDLLQKPRFTKSSTNLEHLLTMIEIMTFPLTNLSRSELEEGDFPLKEKLAACTSGKEWVDIPRCTVAQPRLQLLCSILMMESCREAAFAKVNVIISRLCKVEANRGHVLCELASVAQALGDDAKRDLRALRLRMHDAAAQQKVLTGSHDCERDDNGPIKALVNGNPSRAVTLSNSNSELKLLRVLQTLQSLCSNSDEGNRRKTEVALFVSSEHVEIMQGINLGPLWDQLSSCLKVVRVLEGISTADEGESSNSENGDDPADENADANENIDSGSDAMLNGKKKLQNSSAGLLTRFLPAIEAFFIVNASSSKQDNSENSTAEQFEDQPTHFSSSTQQKPGSNDFGAVSAKHVINFVAENKVILNALVRNNGMLLEKGLRALVQVPKCRSFLDFDVKRQWFKSQIRRLRQQASRRHGSLRLTIRRKHVFEDAYHQLRLRNADEMRSRLHITFRNEEGVDAGGLSREFFGILAREIFNPNYALFTSTEDGCTFQPNPNSSINPDHLSYFRFVGRIVGKAVADGFLLDAHFTRSLYKHMLGVEPTHHDMEAIDPDYYRNLKLILEYSLADIGLELTFSINDVSFGRSQVIDLIPDGRNVFVTDETKAKYVSLVCKHRMTTSIKSQIKAYLDGFYELVSRDLIAVFTPRELELLISGLPDIDVLDLQNNTEYQGWKATDPEIQWFWKIMGSLSRSERAAFLQFVTGSSKVPLAGFSELQGMRGTQKFSIHKASGSSGALMSAHTCFNSLDLPNYSSEDEMRDKFLYAISEGQGSFMFA